MSHPDHVSCSKGDHKNMQNNDMSVTIIDKMNAIKIEFICWKGILQDVYKRETKGFCKVLNKMVGRETPVAVELKEAEVSIFMWGDSRQR